MHPNEGLLRKGYDAFNSGDIETLREVFAPDITFHSAGRVEGLSGDFKGADETFAFFGQLAERTGGTFDVQLETVFVNDERGVVLSRGGAEREGRSWSGMGVEVFRFADGRIAEAWTMSYDQQGFDEFLS